MEKSTCKIKLPDDLSLFQTVKVPTILKICVGAWFLVTVHVNVVEKLNNSSMWTLEYIHFSNPNKPFHGEIYVKFD